MTIVRYIPIKKNIIDRRTDEGGYYEATCDICSNTFYPKRSNAIYCSKACQQAAFRIKMQNGSEIRKKKEKKDIEVKIGQCIGNGHIAETLSDVGINTSGQKGSLRKKARALNVGEFFMINANIKVKKMSSLKYCIYEVKE